MNTYTVYNNQVTIENSAIDIEKRYDMVSDIMYQWLHYKYHPVFSEMPKQKDSMSLNDSGYSLSVKREETLFEMQASHVDM